MKQGGAMLDYVAVEIFQSISAVLKRYVHMFCFFAVGIFLTLLNDRSVHVSKTYMLLFRVSSGYYDRAFPRQSRVMKSCMLVVMLSCGAEDQQNQQVLYRCYAASRLIHLYLRSVSSYIFIILWFNSLVNSICSLCSIFCLLQRKVQRQQKYKYTCRIQMPIFVHRLRMCEL